MKPKADMNQWLRTFIDSQRGSSLIDDPCYVLKIIMQPSVIRVKVVALCWVVHFLERVDDRTVVFRDGTKILHVHYLTRDMATFNLSCDLNTGIEFDVYYPTSGCATSQGADWRPDSWSTRRTVDTWHEIPCFMRGFEGIYVMTVDLFAYSTLLARALSMGVICG